MNRKCDKILDKWNWKKFWVVLEESLTNWM